jgi:hypothetical protein
MASSSTSLQLITLDLTLPSFRLLDTFLLDISPYISPASNPVTDLVTTLINDLSLEEDAVREALEGDDAGLVREEITRHVVTKIREAEEDGGACLGGACLSSAVASLSAPHSAYTTPVQIHIRVRHSTVLYTDTLSLSPASLQHPGSTVVDIATSLRQMFHLPPQFQAGLQHSILTQLASAVRGNPLPPPSLSLTGKYTAVTYDSEPVDSPSKNVSNPMIVNFTMESTKNWESAMEEYITGGMVKS